MKALRSTLLVPLVLCGCAATQVQLDVGKRKSTNVDYSIAEKPSGFTVELRFPNEERLAGTKDVEAVCRRALPFIVDKVMRCRNLTQSDLIADPMRFRVTRDPAIDRPVCRASASFTFR